MTDNQKEIMKDLLKVLDKMTAMDEKEGKQIFSDEAYMHLSYTIENVSGIFGGTNANIEEHRPAFFNKGN